MARQCEIPPRGERAPDDHRCGHRQASHAIEPPGAHWTDLQLHKQFSALKWLRTASTTSNADCDTAEALQPLQCSLAAISGNPRSLFDVVACVAAGRLPGTRRKGAP